MVSNKERLAIQTGEWFEALRINGVDDIEAHLEAIKLIKDIDDVGNVKRYAKSNGEKLILFLSMLKGLVVPKIRRRLGS